MVKKLVIILAALGASAAYAQTKTAQSIMIDTSSTATALAIDQTQKYKFDVPVAATYFNNAWDNAVPSASCSGNGCGGVCPQPPAPAAPLPLASQVIGGGSSGNGGADGVAGQNRCTFLDGGTLTGGTYTQKISNVNGGCNVCEACNGGSGCGTNLSSCPTVNGQKYKQVAKSASWDFTYTYAVTPNIISVAAFTAWDLIETSGDNTVSLDVNALIAGESVSVSKNLGTKYSFSLLQNDGVTPRISNVCVSVDGGAATCVPYPDQKLAYVDRNPSGPTPALDYLYNANALTCNGTACTSLMNGSGALAILNGDAFAGNDNGGANGQALAAMLLSAVPFDLTVGDHAVTITAKVKENDGTLVGTVGVTLNVTVVTPGCGGQ